MKRERSVGTVEGQWDRRRCRVESGISWPDDTWTAMSALATDEYGMGERVALDALDPDGWSEIEAHHRVESGDYIVYSGGQAWEGAGFVALEKDGGLVWLLQLNDSEMFGPAKIEGELMTIESCEYPWRILWQIPLADPARLIRKSTPM